MNVATEDITFIKIQKLRLAVASPRTLGLGLSFQMGLGPQVSQLSLSCSGRARRSRTKGRNREPGSPRGDGKINILCAVVALC